MGLRKNIRRLAGATESFIVGTAVERALRLGGAPRTAEIARKAKEIRVGERLLGA